METLSAQALVARNVKRVRKLRDVSQAQLARRLGWQKSTLNKLESGADPSAGKRSRGVGVDDLLSLALALDVAPAVLLCPWEDDEELAVEIQNTGLGLGSAEAFGWVIGAPDLGLYMYANPVDYFTTTPAAVQRRYGSQWLRRVREELGWEISDDGRSVKVPGAGISVRRGEED